MCATCGCGIPEETHGDDRNIPWSRIVSAGEAASIPPAQAVKNIAEMSEDLGYDNSGEGQRA